MKKMLLTTCLIVCAIIAKAQTVTGTVTDQDDGSALPGVSIVIKGTTQGTITDANGQYSISASEGDVLSFSYIGYAPQEATVGSQSTINIGMEVDISELQEVVVIGFGTQEKKDVTGAISSVDGEQINRIPSASFEQGLIGTSSGVQVVSGSGNPGAGAVVRIRGIGSVNNSEPLYVVDGVIIGNVGSDYAGVSPLAFLNPEDIKQVDILKDASATAIYGARAGNGVVLITTKRGDKGGGLNLTFSANNTWSVLDDSKWDRMDGPTWAEYYDQTQLASGDTTYLGDSFVQSIRNGARPDTYDWIDEVSRTGMQENYNISLNGGNKVSQYYASVAYTNSTGYLINSDFERYSVRFNSDHNLLDGKVKFGNSFVVSQTKANIVGNADPNEGTNQNDHLRRLLYINPYKPIYDDSSNYAGLEDFQALYDTETGTAIDHDRQNRVARLQRDKKLREDLRILATINVDWEIIKGLTFRTALTADLNNGREEDHTNSLNVQGEGFRDESQSGLSMRSNESMTWLVENTLTFDRQFGDHGLTFLAGYQAQNTHFRSFSANQSGFTNFGPDIWHFNQNDYANPDQVGSDEWESAWVSFFGRAIYDYKDKYLLTATLRRDGSSKFGEDSRFGSFPAASLAWRISEEDFFQGGLGPISTSKLRIGYGVSGSDNTQLYQYTQQLGADGDFNYVLDGSEAFGSSISRPANALLQWEEIKSFNVGLDVGLWRNRVELNMNYFDRTTDKMFFLVNPPLEGGFQNNVAVNASKINNKGFEFDLNSTNIVSPLVWRTNFNFSVIRNEVLEVEFMERIGGINGNVNQVFPGGAIGEFYGYQAIGIFEDWDDVYNSPYQNQATLPDDIDPITGENSNDPDGDGINNFDTGATDFSTTQTNTSPGDIKFQDTNGDGVIDEDDYTVIGDPNPDFVWGMTNTFEYKNFSLSILLQGVHGNDIYNGFGTSRGYETQGFSNRSNRVLEDRWHPETNRDGSNPRLTLDDPNRNRRNQNSVAIEDGSFVRIKNVKLAYNLPRNIISKIGASSFNVFISATNLHTFTNYSGFDPELGIANTGQAYRFGVDDGTVQLTKQYSVGATITF